MIPTEQLAAPVTSVAQNAYVKNNPSQTPSQTLLATGLGEAGTLAAFTALSNKKLGFKGSLTSKKNLLNAGKAGLMGGAILAPASYLAAKANEKYKDDKSFNAGHFAAIAAPSAFNATMASGIYNNAMSSARRANNGISKSMSKDMFSVKRNLTFTENELGKAKNSMSRVAHGGKLGSAGGRMGGLLALGFGAMSAIDPLTYAYKTTFGRTKTNETN